MQTENRLLTALLSQLAAISNDTAAPGQLGNVAVSLDQRDHYAWEARRPGVKIICESGFSHGHSAALFLQANPAALYVGLDRWHAHGVPQAFLNSSFPGRFAFVHGDTSVTLPALQSLLRAAGAWGRARFTGCDLISVDGNWAKGGVMTELTLWERWAHHSTELLVDDCSWGIRTHFGRRCNNARTAPFGEAVGAGLLQNHGGRVAPRLDAPEFTGIKARQEPRLACWCQARYARMRLDSAFEHRSARHRSSGLIRIS